MANVTTISRVSTAVSLGVNMALSAMLARTRPKKAAPESMELAWLSVADVEITDRDEYAFSEADLEVDPLTEAEIYVIYGRPDDARFVLAAAEESGRLTAERIAQFWSEQEEAKMARLRRREEREMQTGPLAVKGYAVTR